MIIHKFKVKPFFFIFSCCIFLFTNAFAATDKTIKGANSDQNVWPKTLMLRVKPEFKNWLTKGSPAFNSAQLLLNELAVAQVFKRFPNRVTPKKKHHIVGELLPDMSLVFQLHYKNEISAKDASGMAMNLGIFEYAEPKYKRQTCFETTDPSRSLQYYLDSIRINEAWDITQGDTNIVVGICDSGVQIDHEDIKGQIKIDPSDPVNGLDDNNDGNVDNFQGWDFAGDTLNYNFQGDNNPNITDVNSTHGTTVAGLVIAKASNGIGISGIAFKCKILPIKCSPDNNGTVIYYGYEAIEYAAAHGAQIINCSWGGPEFSRFEQEVITDATLNFNCLIVAAVGNNNSPNSFYPAYYDHVLSVSALQENGIRSGFSNYNSKVRVSAPGSDILSTYFSNTYGYSSGTSSACPIVAGVAALVKSKFPNLTSTQIAQRIRVTSDDVYATPGNNSAQLSGKLGKGKVNAYRALTESSPGIKQINLRVTDNNNDIFQSGDTLCVRADFINLLDASSANLTVRFSIVVGGTSIYTGEIASTQEYVLGELATNQISNNNSSPFKFYLKPNLPVNRSIEIKIYYSDGKYYDFDFVYIPVNSTYIDIEKNNISTTITSKGRIGFDDDANALGLGFRHKGVQTLFELGLMTGTSEGKLANTVRSASNTYDNEYKNITYVKEVLSQAPVFEYFNKMSDDNAGTSASKIEILQRSIAYTSAGDSNYIILKYAIRNKNSVPITNFHIGFFGDFDISIKGQADKAGWSESEKMGFVYNTNANGRFAGIAILGDGNPNYYAIDNDGTSIDTFGVYDGFSDQEKFKGLSSGIYRKNAGVTSPKDVSMVIGSGPYSILPNDTLNVGFAVVAGENLDQIRFAAQMAQANWQSTTAKSELILGIPSKIQIFPNPASKCIFLSGSETVENYMIMNAIGQKMNFSAAFEDGRLAKIDISAFPKGIYFIKPAKGEILRFVKE